MGREPFAARLHFIPRMLRRPHAFGVRLIRAYLDRAPGWVLLTTCGRKTGLPRQVVLPCERTENSIIVISTFGWRSNWIRNLEKDPSVQVTCAGMVLPAKAEILEDLEAKLSMISAHPFFPLAPFVLVHVVLRVALRPLLVLFLRRWVAPRPVVVIHLSAMLPGASLQH